MDFETYARNLPKLHSWDGGKTWTTGGFNRQHLASMHRFIRECLPVHPRILETGAGNSTLCFLFTEPSELISIAPDPELFERIEAYCRANGLSTASLRKHVDGSQWALPKLAAQAELRVDFALIDGCHNWPMVMVDFFYVNYMLAKNGFVMLDDISLYSVRELARCLAFDLRGFRVRANLGKALIFEKLTDERQLGEWPSQPYLVAKNRTVLNPRSLGLGSVRLHSWISGGLMPLWQGGSNLVRRGRHVAMRHLGARG